MKLGPLTVYNVLIYTYLHIIYINTLFFHLFLKDRIREKINDRYTEATGC